MYKKMIEQFLDKYADDSEDTSFAEIAHFKISFAYNQHQDLLDELQAAAVKAVPDRGIAIEKYKAKIDAARSASDIITLMRREREPFAELDLVKKALEFEQELVPEVLRRFRTNSTDNFVEAAAQFLASSTLATHIADTIMGYYDEIVSPFTQGVALLILGFLANEDAIPWIIDQHSKLEKRSLSEEHDYEECALFALIEMEQRFYT